MTTATDSMTRTNTESNECSNSRSLVTDKMNHNLDTSTSSPSSSSPTNTTITSSSTSTMLTTGTQSSSTFVALASASDSKNCESTMLTSPWPLPHAITPSRSRSRYPTELGRVPLHRRGKSQTYECLEDLLQEAGYKETRILSPDEHSNNKIENSARVSSCVKTSVDTLVGYIASAFVPSRTSLRMVDQDHEDIVYHAHSPSPLLRRPSKEPYSTTDMENSELTPRLSQKGCFSGPLTNERYHSSTTSLPLDLPITSSLSQDYRRAAHIHGAQVSYNKLQLRQKQEHRYNSSGDSSQGFASGPIRGQDAPIQNTQLQHSAPAPSRAGAYLRHMMSAPNVPTTAATVKRKRESRFDKPAQLLRTLQPKSWLECVARTLMFGQIGSVGNYGAEGSGFASASTSTTSLSTLGTSYAGETMQWSRQCAYGYRNKVVLRGGRNRPALPELFAKLERGRARSSRGEVNRTSVVCRSEPVSRGSSRVRAVEENGKGLQRCSSRLSGRVVESKQQKTARGKSKPKELPGVPMLASTEVLSEGDDKTRREGEKWDTAAVNMDADEEEEEDEGELDLAQMLVPPKRQNSIRSLRKHMAIVHSHAHQRQRRRDDVSVGSNGFRAGAVGRKNSSRGGPSRGVRGFSDLDADTDSSLYGGYTYIGSEVEDGGEEERRGGRQWWWTTVSWSSKSGNNGGSGMIKRRAALGAIRGQFLEEEEDNKTVDYDRPVGRTERAKGLGCQA